MVNRRGAVRALGTTEDAYAARICRLQAGVRNRRAGAGALQRLAAAGGGQRDCGTGDVPTVMLAPRCRTCTGMRNLLAAQNLRSKTGVAENGGWWRVVRGANARA